MVIVKETYSTLHLHSRMNGRVVGNDKILHGLIGPEQVPGGTQCKRLWGCAANMGSKISLLEYEWPLIKYKIWYMNGQFFKICPNMSQNWLKLRKFWKNQVILLQIWSKIGPIADVAISTPSVVHCMNATASAQSPKFLRKQFWPTSAGNAQAQLHFCG